MVEVQLTHTDTEDGDDLSGQDDNSIDDISCGFFAMGTISENNNDGCHEKVNDDDDDEEEEERRATIAIKIFIVAHKMLLTILILFLKLTLLNLESPMCATDSVVHLSHLPPEINYIPGVISSIVTSIHEDKVKVSFNSKGVHVQQLKFNHQVALLGIVMQFPCCCTIPCTCVFSFFDLKKYTCKLFIYSM